jgi:hypothetical protein
MVMVMPPTREIGAWLCGVLEKNLHRRVVLLVVRQAMATLHVSAGQATEMMWAQDAIATESLQASLCRAKETRQPSAMRGSLAMREHLPPQRLQVALLTWVHLFRCSWWIRASLAYLGRGQGVTDVQTLERPDETATVPPVAAAQPLLPLPLLPLPLLQLVAWLCAGHHRTKVALPLGGLVALADAC